ncbi:hypothetical protein MTR67_004753 [Solanum verrucosum]|uniref:non-specific serine/threonine protein kinase n=1 Tax=Solanum verrucosum TaxID=315347 RepID=A0AAF0PUN1_SOLVR|nr:hypothetical protein MTR67_004753 [Solanum verrucosum]
MPPENPFSPPLTPLPVFPTTYLIPPPPPPSSNHHHSHSPLIPPFIAAAFALTFFIVAAIIYRKVSRNRTVPADLKSPPPPHKFTYSVLRRATGSFTAANRLGQGGFGSVYKGVLPSGQEVAVKLMDASGSLQGEREFHNELTLASRFSSDEHSYKHHCSSRRRRRLVLVYEYMHNGSLQDALLDRKCPELMQWRKRFDIISSIAKGVEYLHYSCDPPIVHGDIKPSNILLDYHFDAKIADFGLAQSLIKDDQVVESFIEGTVCYIAPEYGGGGQLSEKCDVYSFGVLLLVLARQLAHSGKLLDLVDPNIQLLDREQALLCITIALLCLQRSPNKRPTMKEIVGMLCGDSEPPHLPFEFSPSPPSNFPFESRKKAR